MRILAAAMGILLSVGCDRSTLSGAAPDLAAGTGLDAEVVDLAGGRDLSARDLAFGDAAGCSTHVLEEVPLTGIAPLDRAYLGAAVRLRLEYLLGNCDVPAGATARFTPGNATDFVGVRMRVWRYVGGEPGCAGRRVAAQAMALPDGWPATNWRLVVTDESAGGTVSQAIGVGERAIGDCAMAPDLGEACQLDCQCRNRRGAQARCVGVGPGVGVCALHCNVDAECPRNRPRCAAATDPAFTCREALPGGACAGPCGFGTRCQDGACRPMERAPDGKCACDRDCGANQLCAGGECRTPCGSVAECPAGANYCGTICGWP